MLSGRDGEVGPTGQEACEGGESCGTLHAASLQSQVTVSPFCFLWLPSSQDSLRKADSLLLLPGNPKFPGPNLRCCVFFLPTERNCRLGEKAVRTDGKSVPDIVFAHVREHRLRVYEDQDLWKFRVAHHLPSPHV